ncbi:type IV secretion system protein [Wolbachia endosymbiont (group E) of Neria commutata]|uniref:type IV secretion system protein n=1 Tax=Wolbachia endosymbiont (group E) of Neria commutata TaxID=3066149 RepID=UPI003132BADB
MFKTKLSLLLIAIFLLNIDFLLSYPVFADEVSGTEKTEFVSRFNSTGSFSRASNPDCGAFKTAAAIAGIAIAVGAIFTGIVIIVSSIGIFTALVIIGMIAAIVGVWKAIGGLVVCQHSFVKHPVARDHDGNYKDFELSESKYKGCTGKNYQKEEEYFLCLQSEARKIDPNKKDYNGKKIEEEILNLAKQESTSSYYWPKNSVQYSEYIEICHRNPLTFGNLFSDIKFDLREKDTGYESGPWSPKVDGELVCKALKAGQSEVIHGSTFKAVKKMGRLCVELANISTLGINMTPWPQGIDIGCTELPPDPLAPMCPGSKMKFKNKDGTGNEEEVPIGADQDHKSVMREMEKKGKIFVGYDNKSCFQGYISEACYNQVGSKSLAPIPITSMIVQCIRESLDNLVAGLNSDGTVRKDQSGEEVGSFISVAQKRLKNTVTAVLVLALVLFSIKVMSGGVQRPQEMYMLIIKFALVMYFTTGGAMQYYYGQLTKLSNGLSEIVLKASSESKNICNYEAGEDYQHTRNGEIISYSYLAPWDRLDCRILFYLGAPLQGVGGKIGTAGVIGLTALLGAGPILLVAGSVIGILFAGGQILVALVAIFMAILLMMVVLWMCYIFILSLIALSVIVILSPLFIPMVLFQHTKEYFNGWIKELITYSIYPVMLFSFLSFMFIACDKVYYKDLKFEKEKLEILDNKKYWFKLKDVVNSSGDKVHPCSESKNATTLACMLQDYNFEKSSLLAGLIDYKYVKFRDFQGTLIVELSKLCLVLFLFYHFLHILPSMAAELAGNHRSALGSGSTPGQMIGKAISAGKAVAGGAAGVTKALAKKALSKAKSMVTRPGGPQGNSS